VYSGFGCSCRQAAYRSLNPTKLAGAPGDRANGGSGELAGTVALRHECRSGKKLVTIFQHVHSVGGTRTITVDVVCHGAAPRLRKPQSVNHGRVGRESAVKLVNSHLMTRHVSHINDVLLRIFAVFWRHLIGDPLLLLCKRTCGNCNGQAQNRHHGQRTYATSVHYCSPLNTMVYSPRRYTRDYPRRRYACCPVTRGTAASSAYSMITSSGRRRHSFE